MKPFSMTTIKLEQLEKEANDFFREFRFSVKIGHDPDENVAVCDWIKVGEDVSGIRVLDMEPTKHELINSVVEDYCDRVLACSMP